MRSHKIGGDMGKFIIQEVIENKIYLVRGHKVMIDKDLAALYGVRTKNLNKAIKRNINRFPEDFMFQLTGDEFKSLRFQSGTSKQGRGGRRYVPYVFTEHGVAMLSSVLNSERAISINIAIMRTFARLRHMLATHKDLAEKLDKLENKTNQHDKDIFVIFETIRQLMTPPPAKARVITGFKSI
jgi:phage regulator Rha-like protein